MSAWPCVLLASHADAWGVEVVTNLPCDLHVPFIAGEVRVLTDALYSQVLDWGRLCGEERGGGVRETSLGQSSVLCVR